ncbi:MAG: hypothetical protein CMA80_02965 [Euryarchaeota archaeon]|nr:hypothetical protein [Euryarchaeota archaeon]
MAAVLGKQMLHKILIQKIILEHQHQNHPQPSHLQLNQERGIRLVMFSQQHGMMEQTTLLVKNVVWNMGLSMTKTPESTLVRHVEDTVYQIQQLIGMCRIALP